MPATHPDACAYNPITHEILDHWDHPGHILMPLHKAIALHDQAMRTPPAPIAAIHFREMLDSMPTIAHHATPETESFKLDEPVSRLIAHIFVRLDARYFHFHDHVRLTHAECCATAARTAP